MKQRIIKVRIEKDTITDKQELLFLKKWLKDAVTEERYELAQLIKNRIVYLNSLSKEDQ